VQTGSAHMHILETIKHLECDLLILGSHSRNSLPGFIGSTAHALAHHAPCDILTLRSG
jgi:universal stress protein A